MQNSGIWTIEEAKTNHAFSLNLAKSIAVILDLDKPIADLGCGNGSYLDFFRNTFKNSIGVDGTDFNRKDILVHDLSKPILFESKYQIVCLEVGEHISSEFENQFIDNLVNNSSGIIVLSWAIIGQGGLGHVNERPNKYIIDEMNARGFYLNEDNTNYLRENMENDALWWFKSTLMVFNKKQ